MKMKSLVIAALLAASPVAPHLSDYGKNPTVDLSAIRMITCEGGYYGSGFLIADNILATALHVANLSNCKDKGTGTPVKTYYQDPTHDFALMRTSIKGIPPLRYNCSRYVTGKHYASYGYSAYLQPTVIFRQSDMTDMGEYSGPSYIVSGKAYPHMRHLYGPMVFGHSGGPILDTVTGNVVGINNSGETTIFGLITGHSYSTELADTVLCAKGR